MAIHSRQHPRVGEKAVAEAGFGFGDGHSTSVEYERKTLVNGAVFWFAVAYFRLVPAAQSCCSELYSGHLRTLRRMRALKIPISWSRVPGWRGGLRVTKEHHFLE